MALTPKIDFPAIAAGDEKFPRLLHFKELPKKDVPGLVAELNKATLKDLKAGKGPASYEEAHRVFANWRFAVDQLKGLAGSFRRIRSDNQVKAIRDWTLDLLKTQTSPAAFLYQFTIQLDKMVNQNTGYANPCYTFSDGVKRDVMLRLIARKKKVSQAAGHAPSSYEVNTQLPDGVRKICEETEGFPDSDWTDKDLLSIIEHARVLKSGRNIFVDHAYIKAAAKRVSEEVL